jgi:predicted DNA-binding transcriptional regulator YafY
MPGPSARLLTLLSLLQARRDWPGQLLAERLEISERTVRRDVDRLRELGYPIHAAKGPDGGYRLEAGSELPPLLFDDAQAVALAVALRVATASGAGIGEAAARALVTVRQVMPARLRHRIDALEVSAVRRTTATEDTEDMVDPGVLVALASAVRSRDVVRFDYDFSAGAPRRAEPHHVVTRAGRWYLVAFDLDRADWRTFRVDRIALRTPNGPRFIPRELPGGADPATFLGARFKGSAGADEWPCRGEVVLHLPARDVTPYAGDATLEELGPDRCRLVIGSWSWTGLVGRLLQYDAEIEVIGPVELRDELARTSERCARAARG